MSDINAEPGDGNLDTENLELDPFELAFEEASGIDASVVEDKVEDKPVEDEVEDVVEDKQVEDKVEPEAKVEPEVKVDPEVKVEPPAKTEAQIRQEILDEQAAATTKAKQDDDSKAAKEALEAKTKLTDEEQAILDAEQKDFPGLTKLLAANQRIAEAKFEIKLAEMREEMQASLQPIIETSNAVASNSFEAAVLKHHEDALTLLPTVREWVAKQPAFLANAYTDALQNGSVQDVADVFTTYKSTLPASVAAEPTAEEIAAKKIADDKAAAEELAKQKKLDSMSSVRTAATQRTAGIDENDFEGAFEQAAAAMS